MIKSTFQFVVRTTVNSGAGCRTLLPEAVRGLGGRRAVLFTDKGLVNAGVVEKVTQLFSTIPGSVELVGVFDEIEQDAKANLINRAAEFYRIHNGDAMIALGGGSVLDTVKGVKWMLSKGLKDIHNGLFGNVLEYWPKANYIPIPHLAIPTTAGTGAEVSPIAVVFNEQANVKVNVIHPFINADIAFLDPELTVGLPPFITAFTGFDALTHAIEGYFSPHANPMTDAYALQAMRMISENLETAVKNGTDVAARANMLMASCMAISAFSLAMNAIPVHNMAHAFGAKFGIPHGLANAVLLPYVMSALKPMYLPRIQGFAEAVGIKDIPEQPDVCFEKAIAWICHLREKVGLPSTFADYSMDKEVLRQIVDVVHLDPAGVVFRIPDQVIMNVTKEVTSTPVQTA